MDTSEKYIRMCDCPEVQGQFRANEGDWLYCTCGDIEHYPGGYGINVITTGDADIGNMDLKESESDVWLPRQDQIQGMLEEDWQKTCVHFVRYVTNDFAPNTIFYTRRDEIGSMEQLWLAFYMHEKHGKIWDDEKGWVDE